MKKLDPIEEATALLSMVGKDGSVSPYSYRKLLKHARSLERDCETISEWYQDLGSVSHDEATKLENRITVLESALKKIISTPVKGAWEIARAALRVVGML